MRIKKIAIITILAPTGLVAIVGAQASLDQCNSNRVCMWGNNDFKWLIGERAPGGGLVNLSGDRNDEMDSWANRTVIDAAGYATSNGRGDCQTFGRISNNNNVSYWSSDEVSSWRTNRGC